MKHFFQTAVLFSFVLIYSCNSIVDRTIVTAYYIKAANAFNEKKYETAIDYYSKALAIDTGNAVGYSARGWVKYCIHDSIGAMNDYNKAISLNPDDAQTYNLKGLLEGDLNKPDSAIMEFNRAIKLKPVFAYAYNNRSYIEYERHETNAAFADNHKSLLIDSNNSWAYVYRGIMKLEFFEDTTGAMDDYNKALTMPNSYERAYFEKGKLLITKGEKDLGCYWLQKAKKSGYAGAEKVIENNCK